MLGYLYGKKPIGSGYFRAKPFPYKYPNILKPSHPSYLPAYEDGTDRVFRNVGIKIQMPGNYPEESKNSCFEKFVDSFIAGVSCTAVVYLTQVTVFV